MKTILQVTGLRVERGNTVILDNIDWCVRLGEHWVILGANGSGKTSLLSALAGYLTPTAGAMEVLGDRYGETDWRELRQRIGLVSSSVRQMMADDEPAIETVVSGRYAMIDYWGPVTKADRQRARQILRQVESEYLADRPWRVLSQGERQRVLIGRALMAKPALLILDEPCAGLDPVAREHFLQFLQRLSPSPQSSPPRRGRGGRISSPRRGEGQGEGPTMVLVTHHVEEIMPVFTDVLVLKGGRVFASGRKREVMKNLRQAFGAPVTLRENDGRYSLVVRPNRRVVA